MIEKKITYDINIEKPSKTKPVKQGGVLNFLGKQKTVNAPVKWRSSKDHPVAHLAYITKDEEKILIDLNLYGSLKGKPNRGPFGLPSLQGSGGGAGGGDGGGGDGGGDSGDSGDSGDAGDAGDVGDSGGTSSAASAADAGFGDSATGEGGGTADAGGPSGPGGSEGFSTDVGPAPGEAVGMGAPSGISSAISTVQNALTQAVQNAINNPLSTIAGIAFGPVGGLAARGIAAAVDAANRGVTAPNDFSQATESVQSGPAQSPSGGDAGITTLPQYAPLYNQATGDPLLDSLIARYRANISPASFGV